MLDASWDKSEYIATKQFSTN